MKTKFINVWDAEKSGYVGFIILQVEESDIFLTERDFNPGYKFIVQASYHHVGAAGGHKFIPAYGESVRDKSQKIRTTEADVLGFYLSEVKDIYELPDDLNTEKFWNVLHTTGNNNSIDEKYDIEDYYKVLYKYTLKSWKSLREDIFSDKKQVSEILGEDMLKLLHEMDEKIMKMAKWNKELDNECEQVWFAYVDKKTLMVQGSGIIFASKEKIISDYLWKPNTPLPKEYWEEVKKKNSSLEVDDISNEIPNDAELYYN